MVTIRRWYIYLVCAISLQAVAWAIISLLNDLLTAGRERPALAVAFEISVIVIGFPIFLAHWLWAQWLTRREPDERSSLLRRVYLYGMAAGFLAPFLANSFALFQNILFLLLRVDVSSYEVPSALAIERALLTMLPLSLFWCYHILQIKNDERLAPPEENTAVVRRLSVLGFSAIGLVMVLMGSIQLLRWLLYQVSGVGQLSPGASELASNIAILIVGLPVWLIYWTWAQHLYAGAAGAEKASALAEKTSALRKFYLYAFVFTGVLGVVANASFILADLLHRGLGLEPEGDIRNSLSMMAGMAVLWAYQAYWVQRDARQVEEAPRQAAIRRLYLCLVAGIGLAVFLAGSGGLISVLIRAVAGAEAQGVLKEQLAWFTAALVTGLPVWLIPWRNLQRLADQPGSAGADECRSVVRRIYLYVYIFAATIGVLVSAIAIAYQFVSALLGEEALKFSDLAQAFAFLIIAAGVWLYHGSVVRGDGKRLQRDQAARLNKQPLLVVSAGDEFAEQLAAACRREIPGLLVEILAMEDGLTERAAAQIGAAGVILIPWVLYQLDDGAYPDLAPGLAASLGRKILLPVWPVGWDWAGVEHWSADGLIRQAVLAVKQAYSDEPIHLVRPLGIGTIVAIGFVLLILLSVILGLIGSLANGGAL